MCVYMCIYVCIYMCIYMYICVFMYIYIYICNHSLVQYRYKLLPKRSCSHESMTISYDVQSAKFVDDLKNKSEEVRLVAMTLLQVFL